MRAAGDPAEGALHAEQAGVAGGDADRAAAVAAGRDADEPAGDRRGRPADDPPTVRPWRHAQPVAPRPNRRRSSSGSSAAVAGGLVSIATGGDGGGSIRIPAGYTGLLGMKGTFGRIPRSPNVFMRPNTVVLGCLARSVRDAARYFDVCAGPDLADPTSLPKHPSFEDALGSHDLKGLRVAIIPTFGGVELEPGVEGTSSPTPRR